jgi:hypothetical protein
MRQAGIATVIAAQSRSGSLQKRTECLSMGTTHNLSDAPAPRLRCIQERTHRSGRSEK